MQDFTYDVFFSYRHRPLDGEVTQKAFNLLESYRLPKANREQGFPEFRRAFRDTEELPVSRILTESIDSALRSTNCLVVVCSEDTPASQWIDREVSVFIELGRADFTAHGASLSDAPGPAATAPSARFRVSLAVSGTLHATAYCNLHGLWKADV